MFFLSFSILKAKCFSCVFTLITAVFDQSFFLLFPDTHKFTHHGSPAAGRAALCTESHHSVHDYLSVEAGGTEDRQTSALMVQKLSSAVRGCVSWMCFFSIRFNVFSITGSGGACSSLLKFVSLWSPKNIPTLNGYVQFFCRSYFNFYPFVFSVWETALILFHVLKQCVNGGQHSYQLDKYPFV